jgi:hypothetical protein
MCLNGGDKKLNFFLRKILLGVCINDIQIICSQNYMQLYGHRFNCFITIGHFKFKKLIKLYNYLIILDIQSDSQITPSMQNFYHI